MSSNSSSSSGSALCDVTAMALYIARSLLLFPLSISILVLACSRSISRSTSRSISRSTSRSTSRSISRSRSSPSDVFTFSLLVLELLSAVGVAFYLAGNYLSVLELRAAGKYLTSVIFFGGSSSHVLTCVERYMAVVRPLAYRRLQSGTVGASVRKVGVVGVWLLCLTWSLMQSWLVSSATIVTVLVVFFVFLLVVSFCSVSVLCALIGPGPSEGGGARGRGDQSKQRALHTVTCITATLWVGFLGVLVPISLYWSDVHQDQVNCVVLVCGMWSNLPSSLVLPLLYLQRTWSPACCTTHMTG